MIAIDTNILVRYLADPEVAEGPLAIRLIEHGLTRELPGFVSSVVLVETLWVAKRVYGAGLEQQREIAELLLTMPQLVIEHSDALERALSLPHTNLADCILHEIGQSAGCSYTTTFDKPFAKLEKVELLQ